MDNEILLFVTVLMNFSGILLAYKFFGKVGVFGWIAMSTILANIEVVKCIDIFGMSLTLGNVIYGTTFLATDILSEYYGDRTARKGVLLGFFVMLAFTLIMEVDLLYTPNQFDFADGAMHTIFSVLPRLCVASMVAYLISQTLDTYLYSWARKYLCRDDTKLWVRNAMTAPSQAIDTIIFTLIAFAYVYPWEIVIELMITTYIIKLLISVSDTPFMYLTKRIKPIEVVDEKVVN